MKVYVATDDGEVVGTIEHVEEYDLTKNMARGYLVEKLREMIERHTKKKKTPRDIARAMWNAGYRNVRQNDCQSHAVGTDYSASEIWSEFVKIESVEG
jgi:hypothetical protein